MPLTPGQFIRQQLDAQQLSMKQFVARSGLGLSHAYQLRNDERKRVSAETMDAIARGFGMTPAEASEAMGRGTATTGHDELERLAIVRQVSDADWPAAKRMLLGLAAATNSGDGDAANSSGARINHGRGRQQPPIKSQNRGFAGVLVALRSPFLRRPSPVQFAATA